MVLYIYYYIKQCVLKTCKKKLSIRRSAPKRLKYYLQLNPVHHFCGKPQRNEILHGQHREMDTILIVTQETLICIEEVQMKHLYLFTTLKIIFPNVLPLVQKSKRVYNMLN